MGMIVGQGIATLMLYPKTNEQSGSTMYGGSHDWGVSMYTIHGWLETSDSDGTPPWLIENTTSSSIVNGCGRSLEQR